jgi:hypothetical protein
MITPVTMNSIIHTKRTYAAAWRNAIPSFSALYLDHGPVQWRRPKHVFRIVDHHLVSCKYSDATHIVMKYANPTQIYRVT